MRTRLSLILGILLAALSPGSPLIAQDAAAPPTAEAEAAFNGGEWEKAAAAYEQIVARTPENSDAWFRLGVARQSLGQLEPAVAALEKADALGYPLVGARVRLAAAHARLGHTEQALAWLERAYEVGFHPSIADTISAFESLRADARYEALREQYMNACKLPGHRAFDFWVGEWEVITPQGQVAGTNAIESILGGCALLENWTGSSGGAGKSWNYFNPATGRWRQLWVSTIGDIIDYEGEFRDGAMRFAGTSYHGKRRVLSRMTFTPLEDGRVRQLIEHSGDGGKTWVVWFDGYYSRNK